MQVKCPHCGNIAKGPDDYTGRKVQCPKCKEPHFAVAYEGGVVLADKVKARDAAKKGEPLRSGESPSGGGVGTFFVILGLVIIAGTMWGCVSSTSWLSTRAAQSVVWGLGDRFSDPEEYLIGAVITWSAGICEMLGLVLIAIGCFMRQVARQR